MLQEIYFATGNAGKAREVENILGIPVHQIKIDLREVQALDVRDVIEDKARDAYHQTGKPVLVEDTALRFDAWGGMPGALVSWFMKTVGNEGLCRMMQAWDNRQAMATTMIGYFDGRDFYGFTGQIEGKVVREPRGDMGFGWDAVFEPAGSAKTFAEMTSAEKDAISMRKRAVEEFRRFLNQKNPQPAE